MQVYTLTMEVERIKKLSEVCKLVGVTRRTLQEYDRIHLLKPTDKTDAGYWLYNDEAIQRLIYIQIFIEAGYKRKDIKAIIEAPQLDIVEEYDKIIEALLEKRKRIDGMINTIKSIQTFSKIPEHSLRALNKINLDHIYEQKNFSKCLDESVMNAANYDESDIEEANLYFPFLYQLTAIGCLIGEAPDSQTVQECVQSYYDYLIEKLLDADDTEDIESYTDKEAAELLQECTQEMFNDANFLEMITLMCGNDGVDFIVNALQKYTDKASNDLFKGGKTYNG